MLDFICQKVLENNFHFWLESTCRLHVSLAKTKHPLLFELNHDKIPTLTEIEAFEKRENVGLPEKYRQFLEIYGGGYFVFTNVFSLDANGDFYILGCGSCPLEGYLAISDNGCGDLYVLKIENNSCLDQLFSMTMKHGKFMKHHIMIYLNI
ncbi:MAG: SMI1/KNR4 family protein [Lachnospiraceae bacterium]|nr:SMI1/KNR4 family protein [Lachnospiraceae bacterium]